MSDRVVLFALLLAVPVFALGTGYLIRQSNEAEWRAAVLERYPEIDRKKLDAMPLSRYCSEIDKGQGMPVCRWYPNVQRMSLGSVAAIVVGLGLVAGIYMIGRLARANRNRLVLFFKPGLYLTLATLVFLGLLHSGLFIAMVTLGQIATVGRVMIFGMFVVFAVGIGAAICVIFLLRAIVLMLKIPPTLVFGRTLSESRCPFLWKYIRDLASRANALPPQSIIVGLDGNFFVIDSTIKCFNGLIKGRTLYLSLPFCRILTEPELRAIVGHELGHFKGDDTKFSRRFAPIYRGAYEALATLEQSRSAGIASIGMMPVISVLSYFFESFTAAESEIGRARELAADAVGAQLSDKEAAASALIKVHAFAHLWDGALQRMRDWLNEQKTVTNVSSIFGDYVAENNGASRLMGLDDERSPHPMDTHPPLKARLDALGVSMSSVESAALAIAPSEAAVRLIDRYQEIEEELTKMEQNLMEKNGEVSRNAQLRCPACGKLSPVNADACSCGLRFGRSMG